MQLSSALALSLAGGLPGASGAAMPDAPPLAPRALARYEHTATVIRRIDAPPGCPNVAIPPGWHGAFLGPNWWNPATSCGACAEIHVPPDRHVTSSAAGTIRVKVFGKCVNCSGADWGLPTAGWDQLIHNRAYKLQRASPGNWSYIRCP